MLASLLLNVSYRHYVGRPRRYPAGRRESLNAEIIKAADRLLRGDETPKAIKRLAKVAKKVEPEIGETLAKDAIIVPDIKNAMAFWETIRRQAEFLKRQAEDERDIEDLLGVL